MVESVDVFLGRNIKKAKFVVNTIDIVRSHKREELGEIFTHEFTVPNDIYRFFELGMDNRDESLLIEYLFIITIYGEYGLPLPLYTHIEEMKRLDVISDVFGVPRFVVNEFINSIESRDGIASTTYIPNLKYHWQVLVVSYIMFIDFKYTVFKREAPDIINFIYLFRDLSRSGKLDSIFSSFRHAIFHLCSFHSNVTNIRIYGRASTSTRRGRYDMCIQFQDYKALVDIVEDPFVNIEESISKLKIYSTEVSNVREIVHVNLITGKVIKEKLD